MPRPQLEPFKQLVRQRCGLVLESHAEATLSNALIQRMEASGTSDASTYFACLLASDTEFNELVALLTINETYFFREPGQLALLTEHIVPRLLARTNVRLPLRILSAGCSTGEEPYSIAIALREKFGADADRLVSVIAGDIDRQALAQARLAVYRDYSFRAMPPSVRDRYFTCSAAGYNVDLSVRSMVAFYPLNLLAERLPEPFAGFDIVLFRNVSIYFDQETRKQIQRALYAAMNDPAYLILGTSETLANDLGIFEAIQEQGHFYFLKGSNPFSISTKALKKGAAVKSREVHSLPDALRAVTVPVASEPHENASQPVPAADIDLDYVRDLIRKGDFEQALARLAPLRTKDAAQLDPLILEGYIRLQKREFGRAAAIAAEALAHDEWSAEAHMLLAFLAKSQNCRADALRAFKRTVYSKPDCWPAHYFLGCLLQETDRDRARRAYRTALQQITRNPDPDGGLGLPLDLPVADIRFLCERRSAAADVKTETMAHGD